MAYDGIPKAQEALFRATCLSGRGDVPLAVSIVVDRKNIDDISVEVQAKAYLQQHGVEATLIQKSGSVTDAILKTSSDYSSDLIIMGGYGHSPVKDLVLGSSVDGVLQAATCPILICR